MRKKIIITLLLVVAVLVAWYHSLIGYGLSQGYGQLRIIWNARPVDEVLADPDFPDSSKTKLRLIDEVRQFAIDSLGLKDTDNYKTLYDQQGKEIMWVVTACDPFRFEPKTWTFPIVGKVPYKGYFSSDKAVQLARQLEAEGWDVGLRNPSGWSTLGWFTDPILSGMLERSAGDLANLIIHEMVHATIFIKDSVEFNENLASFIADSATYEFLRHQFGETSDLYRAYKDEDHDYQHYSAHVLRGFTALDSLYQTLDDHMERSYKLQLKQQTIEKIVRSMDTLRLRRFRIPARFREKLPNNDYFINYRRYQAKRANFREELGEKYKGDLRAMIADYQRRYPFL